MDLRRLLLIIGMNGGTPPSGASVDEVALFYDENVVLHEPYTSRLTMEEEWR